MRSDTNLNKRFVEEGVDPLQYGRMPGVLDTSKKVDGKPVLRSHSFSGNESNSVFFNHGGRAFEDISGVTGLDSLADGRAFAFLDFDHDGRNDIVLTNTNNPQLQLFHNRIESSGNFIKVKLVGGNRVDRPGENWSARDPYGAHVLVEVGGKTLRRELRGGDGFAAQNSDTMLIGIGSVSKVEGITVLWPSGRKSELPAINAGSVVTIYENSREAAPKPYLQNAVTLRAAETSLPSADRLELGLDKKINVLVTMTTWCPVCRGEVAHLKRLSDLLGEEMGFYAFPIDPEDGDEKIAAFQKEVSPPYEILSSPTDFQREAIEKLLTKNFGEMPLPSTLILDGEGRVLKAVKGTPTLSQLRLLR